MSAKSFQPKPASRCRSFLLDCHPGDRALTDLASWYGTNLAVVNQPRSTPHPRLRAERAVAENYMVLRLNELGATKILDVGGNPNRHRRLRRDNIWCMTPILDAADYYRRRVSKGKSTSSCNHAFGVDVCEHTVDSHFMFVHSLYYVRPEVLATALACSNLEEPQAFSVHHRFTGDSGKIAEARWWRTKRGLVQMDAGEDHVYTHGDLKWLDSPDEAPTVMRQGKSHRLCWKRALKTPQCEVLHFYLVPSTVLNPRPRDEPPPEAPKEKMTALGPKLAAGVRALEEGWVYDPLTEQRVKIAHVQQLRLRFMYREVTHDLLLRAVQYAQSIVDGDTDIKYPATYIDALINLTIRSVGTEVDTMALGASGLVSEWNDAVSGFGKVGIITQARMLRCLISGAWLLLAYLSWNYAANPEMALTVLTLLAFILGYVSSLDEPDRHLRRLPNTRLRVRPTRLSALLKVLPGGS